VRGPIASLSRWGGQLLELAGCIGWRLAPPRCLLCDGEGGGQSELPRLDLCRHCEGSFLAAAGEVDPPRSPLSLQLTPWAYGWPVDRLILALKFHGDRTPARVLGTLLAMRRAAMGLPLPDLLVPVPLHRARLRQRGYNQSDEIARHASAQLGIPRQPHALVRLRDTPAQSLLSADERRVSLRDAFHCAMSLQGRHVALVDDVLTTGSTAHAAASALAAAGAARIELWALARAGQLRQ
jgi:ComF family protein